MIFLRYRYNSSSDVRVYMMYGVQISLIHLSSSLHDNRSGIGFYTMTLVLLSDVTLNTDDEFVYRDTQYGKIKGFVSERVPGDKVEQFLGIPFAAPPVGNLLFLF
jgi:hypothetical protein